MISLITSRHSLGHWAVGLLLALVALSIETLGRCLTHNALHCGNDSVLALALIGGALWLSALAFGEGPRRWLLKHLEIAVMGSASAMLVPLVLAAITCIIFDITILTWTIIWTMVLLAATAALSLAVGLTWGRTAIVTVATTTCSLIGTLLLAPVLNSSASLAFILALLASACLISHLGVLAETPEPARFTLWRCALRTRDLACETSTPAWLLLLASCAFLAADFDLALALFAPALMAAALYLFDGEGDAKVFTMGAAALVIYLAMWFGYLPIEATSLAGIGFVLLLVCTEMGPSCTAAAAGCLLVGMAAPEVLEVAIDRSLYDALLMMLGTAMAAACILLCYCRPDAILISDFEVDLHDLHVILEYDYDEDGGEDDATVPDSTTFSTTAPPPASSAPGTTTPPTPSTPPVPESEVR